MSILCFSRVNDTRNLFFIYLLFFDYIVKTEPQSSISGHTDTSYLKHFSQKNLVEHV